MEKLELLKAKIASIGKLCVAYSGGVDSSFLLYMAYQVLGENTLAVLIDSPVLARRDKAEAVAILEKMGVSYEIAVDNPFHVKEFTQNSTMRCYFCKKNDFAQILEVAEKRGFTVIADGQNADDMVSKHRPGMKAAAELGVVSPLAECGLTKEDIRRYSKELGVSTWNKPSNACLASRFPYGFEITPTRLSVVEKAEEVLRKRGMEGCRVRWHDNIARIEAPECYFKDILDTKDIIKEIKDLGFKYITLDLEGFRSGSMN